jgi:predicted dehydrogenase
MSGLQIAVIGVGHLGQIHARLLAQVAGAQLAGIVDPSEAARDKLSAELNVPAFADHRAIVEKIDAAIIATPSRLHHAVALDLLSRGVHVFAEKPITLNVGDADDLNGVAAQHGLVLQVGHVERFNPALVAAAPHLVEPAYIDAVRVGPFTCRSTDVGVVLDLMIHDIDIALSLVDAELQSVEAIGSPVIGPNEDWAQARLTFADGCVANLFASRVARHAERSMQVYAEGGIAEIDFAGRRATISQIHSPALNSLADVNTLDAASRAHLKENLFRDYLPVTELPIVECNPLLEEQREFAAAIRGECEVRVTGVDGRNALDVAERVLVQIASHRSRKSASSVGPQFQPHTSTLRGPHWRHAPVRRKAG